MKDEEKNKLVEVQRDEQRQREIQREIADQQRWEAMERFVQHEIFDRHFTELHKAEKKPPKAVNPFKEYFVGHHATTLPEICKTIFQNNDRPKDYAIMFCLLNDNNLLPFAVERTAFFKSWYNFISKPLPPKNNFTAIYSRFDEKEPVCTFNESDNDYKKLRKQFEKALKDNNIR